MAVSGRLAVVVAAGALLALLAPSWPLLAAWNGAVLLLVVVDLWRAGSVRALQLRRDGARATRLGVPAEVDLLITNPGRRPVRGVVRDAWPPSAGASPRAQQLDLPAGDRRRITTTLVPTRRGHRPADRVTVRAYGPFGLAARQGTHRVPWAVTVLPPFHSRKHLPAKLARLRDLDGRTAVLVRGPGTEFDSLREYVAGDDVRSIDWRASARAADVMVRTWRPERDRHVLVVIDSGRLSAGRVGDEPRLDAAMDSALLLAALATRAGDRVDLLAWDRQVRADVRGRSGSELLAAMTRALAPLEASLVETDWRGLVGQVRRRAPQRSLVVLLTALEPAPLDEGLVPVLPLLTGRHQVVLATVADPTVADLAARRGDAVSVYQAAAAEGTRAARDRLEDRLRQCGATVVDALPDQLPPRLADTYLALKAAGRL